MKKPQKHTEQPWIIEFYTTENSSSPVLEFIEALPVDEQSKIKKFFDWLKLLGTRINYLFGARIMTIKNIRYEEWHAMQMEDPEFREALDDLEIGFQIARLRFLKGLTQAQLAEMVGTKQSSIARLESGTTLPRLSFLRKVVNAMGGRVDLNIRSKDEVEQAFRYPITDPVSASRHLLVRDGTDQEK